MSRNETAHDLMEGSRADNAPLAAPGGTKTVHSLDLADLMKFAASIMIFVMHMEVFRDFGDKAFLYQVILSRWGVPFFFVSSSYFLFRRGKNGNIAKENLIRYIQRIALLYLVWFVINLPYTVYKRFIENGVTDVMTWVNFFKAGLLASTFFGSWYLASSMFSAWLTYMLSKKLRTGSVLLIALPLYLLCVLSSLYYGALPAAVKNVMDFLYFPLNLFNGCVYFAIGKWIAENEKRIADKLSIPLCVAGVIAAYLVFCLEVQLATHFSVLRTTDAGLGLIPAAFFLFALCLKSMVVIPNHLQLRKLSTIIYCCQGDIVCVWGFLRQVMHVQSYLVLFAVALPLLIGFCVCVTLLQKKTTWKWCKYLT